MSFRYNQVFFVILIIIVLIPPCHNFVLGNHLINFLMDIQSDVRSAHLLPEPMKSSIKSIKNIVFVLFTEVKEIWEIKNVLYCLALFLCIIKLCLAFFKPTTKIDIPIDHLTLNHFIIIQNIFTSLVTYVSPLFTFLKVLLCVGITFAKRFILVLGTFLIHSIQRFTLALFKPFHSIPRFIHRLFKLFKLRDFFLCIVIVVQVTVIVYRTLLHYKNVYSYENPYEPEVHGTFDQNEYYLWTLFSSFVTNIRDFCGILWVGAEGFGSNYLRRIIFTSKSGSPDVPQVPF